MICKGYIETIVHGDMVCKLGKFQSTCNKLSKILGWITALPCTKSFEVLFFSISVITFWSSDLARQHYWTIAPLYQNFFVFTCKSQHKHEQIDRVWTLGKFPKPYPDQ